MVADTRVAQRQRRFMSNFGAAHSWNAHRSIKPTFSRYVDRVALVLWVTVGARAGKPQEREALGRRAEGHRRQSRVRYEVTSIVKRNSRDFRRFGRLRGSFEKLKPSLKTCQRSGAWVKLV
jgi:hypothetical protein